MKFPVSLRILPFVLILTAVTAADHTRPIGNGDSVLFLGEPYCVQMDWCPTFAFYGSSTPVGYVELTDSEGDPIALLWVDGNGLMTFESSPLKVPPPAGLPLLGALVANGRLQEVDQFFPAGASRSLFMQTNPQ